MPEYEPKPDIVNLVSHVTAAYVSHHNVPTDRLADLIFEIARSLRAVAEGSHGDGETAAKPAIGVRKSISRESIICLLCGKEHKMLKRHLRTAHNMKPEEYKTTFRLRPDYPLVAPNYARERSRMAKRIGLGTQKQRIRV